MLENPDIPKIAMCSAAVLLMIPLITAMEQRNKEKIAQTIAEQSGAIRLQLQTAGTIECHIPHPNAPDETIAIITARMQGDKLVVSNEQFITHQRELPPDQRYSQTMQYEISLAGGTVTPMAIRSSISGDAEKVVLGEPETNGFHTKMLLRPLNELQAC